MKKQTIANILNGICIFVAGALTYNSYITLGISLPTFCYIVHSMFLIVFNGIQNYGNSNKLSNKSNNSN